MCVCVCVLSVGCLEKSAVVNKELCYDLASGIKED